MELNKLTRADFDRARGFIRAHARPRPSVGLEPVRLPLSVRVGEQRNG